MGILNWIFGEKEDDENESSLVNKVDELVHEIAEKDAKISELESCLRISKIELSKSRNDVKELEYRFEHLQKIASSMYNQKVGWRAVAMHVDPEISTNMDKYKKVYKDAIRAAHEKKSSSGEKDD